MGFGSIKIYIENKKGQENNSALMLSYGRFGIMKIMPQSDNEFIGYYVDKLWFITNCDGHITPYSFTFVTNDDKVVTGLLFPIDSLFNKTLFLKGSLYDPRQESTERPYILNTSTACYSGHASATNLVLLEEIMLIICICLHLLLT